MKRIVAALLLACGASIGASQAHADFFVILHTQPDTGKAAERSAERVKRQLNRRCGISAETTHTGALDEIRQDLMIVFLDSYKSRAQAVRALNGVRKCVPDAYIRQAWWKGDE